MRKIAAHLAEGSERHPPFVQIDRNDGFVAISVRGLAVRPGTAPPEATILLNEPEWRRLKAAIMVDR